MIENRDRIIEEMTEKYHKRLDELKKEKENLIKKLGEEEVKRVLCEAEMIRELNKKIIKGGEQ